MLMLVCPQKLLAGCLPKLIQLSELRTLTVFIHSNVPDERTRAWEKEQCSYLRRMGCPDLVSVSFNALITLTRHPEDEAIWKPSGPGMGMHTRWRIHGGDG